MVDAEARQVDELEAIALGQTPRVRGFCRVFGIRRFRPGDLQVGFGRHGRE
jgi:hypothetical protein